VGDNPLVISSEHYPSSRVESEIRASTSFQILYTTLFNQNMAAQKYNKLNKSEEE